MDRLIGMAINLVLQELADRSNLTKYRRAMQKLFLSIDAAYNFSGNQIGASTPIDKK